VFNNLEDLKLFVQVYENKNMSAVANLNKTTASSISKRLTNLEKAFGARLFHRSTRSIQPTEEGQRLYEQSRQLLSAVADYEQEWSDTSQPSGLIRITASASFSRLYLTPLIVDFLKLYPKINISLELSDKVLNIVAEGIDLAIRGGDLTDSSLVAKRIGASPEVLCATPEYLKHANRLETPGDLTQHNCIILNDNNNWEFVSDNHIMHQRVTGSFQTNYSEALLEAVKSHLGVGMICYWQVHEELHSGELLQVLPEFRPGRQQQLYAVYPSRHHLPLKTKVLIQYLEDNLSIPTPSVL